MKILALVILLVGSVAAQVTTPNPIVFPGVPAGSCSATNTAVNQSNGDFYTCNGSVWQKVGSGVTPAGASGSIQINNNGSLGAIANAVVGNVLVSQGVTSVPIFRTFPMIDVRDGYGGSGGVDCTRTNDSTTALNAMIANAPNFSSFIFPYGCQIKITSTINVLNKFGMLFEFQQQANANFIDSGLYWYGAQHGTMLYLNQVHGSEWHHLHLSCSGTNTAFSPGTIGCDVAMLLDETGTINNITTDNSFFDLDVWNQAANPAFIGLDIGPNAPGNVENNYFFNAKVFCAGPASGNTDTGFRIGSAGTGSQPNNSQWSHGGPTNCGRGWWIRGNTAGTNIGNMTFGGNFNSLYVDGGDNINYHDIVDQVSVQPITVTATGGGGAHLIIDNYNTSGTTTGPEINIAASTTNYMQLRSTKLTGGITALAIGGGASLFLTETGPINTNDATFCTVIAANRQFDTYSQFCHLEPIGWKERSCSSLALAGFDGFCPDSTAHRWQMNNNNGSTTTVAGFSDNLGNFASGGNISPSLVTSKRLNVDNATTITSGAFTIGAGWGSTASIAITVTTSKDPAYVVTITTGGSGISANPTLQITFTDGTWTNVPACHQIQTGGNDIFGDVTVTARSATSYTYQWAGTPTTGKTYELTQTCTGT